MSSLSPSHSAQLPTAALILLFIYIFCNQNYNQPKTFFLNSSVEILDISLDDGLIRIASSIASDCYDHSRSHLSTAISELDLSRQFTVSSTRNKFTAVGCDTYALVEGSSPGCVSWCDDVSAVKNGTCSGIGCFQTLIRGRVSDFNPCGYAFVAEEEVYESLALASSAFFYISFGFMIPAIVSSWIFWRLKQKKVVKLRQNLFIRNGGMILEDMGVQKTLTVFTADELEKATNNYDENNIIHREQDHNHGSVYVGTIMSTDGANRNVTIHKCNELITADENFISRIVFLSRINHKNVLQLIGCCLETPSPLLVHDLITIKTLYDYIHDNLLTSWDVCLRIAADTAGALAYVHSSASSSAVPIIHGNLSSSSILLHRRYTVKLCDFALTWPVSCSAGYCALTGYMDPEYLLTGRLTGKSDVFSFGVVLAELLTGKDAVSHEGTLAECFVSSIRDNKLDHILDERMDTVGKIEMLTQVGKVAEKCLSDSSLDRPNMKEVVIALENIIATSTDSGSKPSTSKGDSGS